MEQLSLPYRIALVAILAVGALYLVVLKPGGSGETAVAPLPAVAATTTATSARTTSTSAGKSATAPGVAGLTSAVGKARGASSAQAASDARTAAAAAAASETVKPATPGPAVSSGSVTATTTTTTTPPTVNAAPTAPATTTPAAKPAVKAVTDPSTPLLAELGRGKTVVLLFAGTTASDDRAVRRALKRIDRRGGKVTVRVASLRRVGDYEAITRGVQVQQSPTLLVIGKQRTARTIVGFTTTNEIDQLVADVRRG